MRWEGDVTIVTTMNVDRLQIHRKWEMSGKIVTLEKKLVKKNEAVAERIEEHIQSAKVSANRSATVAILQ